MGSIPVRVTKRSPTEPSSVGDLFFWCPVRPSAQRVRYARAWVTPCEPTAIAVVLRTCFAYREALAEQSALAHSCEHGLASLDYLHLASLPDGSSLTVGASKDIRAKREIPVSTSSRVLSCIKTSTRPVLTPLTRGLFWWTKNRCFYAAG